MSSSMEASIHLEPTYWANLEVYNNNELRGYSEFIQYHTEIDFGAF